MVESPVSPNDGFNFDYWHDMLVTNRNNTAGTSRLYEEWGHVLGESRKKRRGTDVGSSSTVNSAGASDLSEALSSISRDLSLSSSSSSSHGSGEPDQDIEKENLERQQGVYALENHTLLLDNDLADGRSVPDSENEIQTKGTFNTEESSQKLDVPVPEVGMIFSSEDAAYEFFVNYSRGIGFRVRRAKVQRSANGEIRKRLFFCSREGFRSEKQYHRKTKYKRKETRTGCEARIQLTVEDGQWVISQFFERHNHPLNDSGRTISLGKKTSEGTKSVEIYKKGIASCVLRNDETKLHGEDAQRLINYLRQLQVEDPSFFYTIQLDCKCRMSNIFWRDGQSKREYKIFGDVVILDTTLKVEKYDMICAVFLGMNHHRQFIIYGCAFLQSESMETFIWLFETFVEAMGRRQPETIFTDEGLEMANAIKFMMPKTQQKIGLWTIMRNASKHLSTSCEQVAFKSLFCESVFGCETEEEFNSRWRSLLEHFNHHRNPWVVNLHAYREKWSPLFSKNSFTADIQDISALQDLAIQSTSLSTIVQHMLEISERHRHEELLEDSVFKDDMNWMILGNSPIEKQAASEYTTEVFSVFQEELYKLYVVQAEEFSSSGNVHVFKAKEIGKDQVNIVELSYDNDSKHSIACSCKKFERAGILCAHTLKVLKAKEILQIPRQYILRRWTKSARC